MPAERAVVLPLLVVAVAFLRVAPTMPIAVAALLLTGAALLLAARFTATRNEQAFLGVGALAIGLLLPRVLAPPISPPGTLPDGMYALGVAAQLAALVRAYLRSPVGGVPATCAIGLVALAAAGRASAPFGYPVFVALYLATAAFAMTKADSGRPPARSLGLRHAIGTVLILSVGAGAVGLAVTRLPQLHARMMKSLLRGLSDRTGFSTSMQLGDMRGMTQSSEVVLRIRGGQVDHLRGITFRRYQRGYWDASGHEDRKLLELETPRPTGEDAIELEIIGRRSLPVPLAATELWSSTSVLQVDPQGVLHAVPLHRPKRVAFRVSTDAAGLVPGDVPDRPEGTDRVVPAPILSSLKTVLERWGATGKPPREVIRIIRERLVTDYTYSLEFTRTKRLDPVIDFLDNQRRGHCEYFATAAALLARSAGIPARVVGGYVVSEHSALGDYRIVRERDAHAWAEVHIDGRWETLDATPGPLGAVPVTPWAGSVFDYVQTSWEKADDWLAERSQLELSGALVGLMFVLVGVRVWRNRSATGPGEARYEAPLQAFADLARALERAGVPPRAMAEPIEAFARRLAAPTLETAAAAAARDAIADYAAFRYGAARDEGAVVDAMRAARTLVEQRRSSGPSLDDRR